MKKREFDIVIICPGLLEPGSIRGGGCEVTDYNVAKQLSKYYHVALIGPFLEKFSFSKKVYDNLSFEYVPFPAQRQYPMRSTKQYVTISLFEGTFYSFLVALRFLVLARSKPKIIIVHNPQTALLTEIVAKLIGISVVYAEGNMAPWYDSRIDPHKKSYLQRKWREINLALCKFMCIIADAVRAQSDSIKQGMIASGIEPNKIEIISAGGYPPIIKPDICKNTESNFQNIGFIGRLTDEKNASLLVEICKKAIEHNPKIRFQIFGRGSYERKLSTLPNIEHLDFVSMDMLFEKLSTTQIILFFQKELGRAEIECMWAGKVLVVCNIGEIPKKLRDGENCILCEPDPDSYLKAISMLLNTPELMDKISRNARELAEKEYNWNTVGEKWFFFCEKILRG